MEKAKTPRLSRKTRPNGAVRSAAPRTRRGKDPKKPGALPEESARRILDTLPVGFVMLDLRGRFSFVNQRFSEISGFAEGDLVGRAFHLLQTKAPKEQRRELSRFLKSLTREDRPAPVETVLVSRDGREIPISCNVCPLEDERGRPRALLVICQDIAGRLRADRTLRENEERFRALFEGSLDALFLMDPESGLILDANPSAAELLRLPSEKMLGLHYSRLIPARLRGYARERFQELVLDRDPLKPVEMKVLRSDGRERDVELLAQIIQIEGRPALYALFRDITERRKAEESLRESEELYRTLVKTLPDAVTVTDLEGRITEVSRQTIELHGCRSAEELIGKDSLEFVHPGDRERAAHNLRQVREVGSLRHIEYSLLKKDGSSFLGEMNTAMVRNAAGKPKSFVASVRDLTERKRIEEEMARVQRLDSLGILAGGIAHDFNNILSAISMNISMARMYGDLAGDTDKMMLDAETAATRAKGLTQQLLAFAKGYAPVKKALSLADLLQETVRFSLTGSNVRCRYSLPDDLWPVEVDEGQIGQAVQNLIINAEQAMPEGGTIGVTAENLVPEGDLAKILPKNRYVKVTIADQGIGIPKKHLHRIFDPFFTTKQKGSGFGLTTCYTIVAQHEGHIQVESAVGTGTTVHVFLPASGHPLKTVCEKKPLAHTGEGCILLVDDEAIVLAATGEALKRMGYRVEVAEEGGQGVELYRKALEAGTPFAAVIMDLTIPGGMGGKEAVRRILDVDPLARVIVSSGYSSSSVMSRFREYGFSGVVRKPYRIEELGEVLREALQDHRRPA